jgi:hypothetical protein
MGNDRHDGLHTSSSVGAAVVVVKAHDVILTEVIATLHLDEDQRLSGAGVGDPVCCVHGHIDGCSWMHVELFAVECGAAGPVDDEPVLFSSLVPLIAEPPPAATVMRLTL